MADLSAFKRHYEQVELLIAKADKDQLGSCLRTLALDLAYYQEKCGEKIPRYIPGVIDCSEPDEEEVRMLNKSMEYLVQVLVGTVSKKDFVSH